MEPTLLDGDYLIVNKMVNISRISTQSRLIQKEISGIILCRPITKIEKRDILLFYKPGTFDELVIKRCYAVPGDTIDILLKDSILNSCRENIIISEMKHEIPLSRLASNIPNQTYLELLSNQSPFAIPRINDTIPNELKLLLPFNEYVDEEFSNDILFEVKKFLTTDNYYFVIGDNNSLSTDSREWGLVSQKRIVGKVNLILISLDSKKKGIHKIRWNRLLKVII